MSQPPQPPATQTPKTPQALAGSAPTTNPLTRLAGHFRTALRSPGQAPPSFPDPAIPSPWAPERAAHPALTSLAVSAVPVGHPKDGLRSIALAPADRTFGEHVTAIHDTLEAWRSNPMARRLTGLITAYVIGDGIELSSPYRPLNRFIEDFFNDPENLIALELNEWCDELSRTGEIFLTLHTHPSTGMSYTRPIPAASIHAITWTPGDYRRELTYAERRLAEPDQLWYSPFTPEAQNVATPLMLHYAVNRPVGAVRGSGDLDPTLPWLRRYSHWLEDRVRLNAAIRSFLWICYADPRMRATLEAQYKAPPAAGSIIIADKESERWEAIAPNLHAADAQADGRALRWMIAAGGPGTSLLDLGEGEDSNMATGTVMQDQKRRFLKRRQAYICHLLTDLTRHAWERYVTVTGKAARPVSAKSFTVKAPDISPADNESLARAGDLSARALSQLTALLHSSPPTFQRIAIEQVFKFAGEEISPETIDAILAELASTTPPIHQS